MLSWSRSLVSCCVHSSVMFGSHDRRLLFPSGCYCSWAFRFANVVGFGWISVVRVPLVLHFLFYLFCTFMLGPCYCFGMGAEESFCLVSLFRGCLILMSFNTSAYMKRQHYSVRFTSDFVLSWLRFWFRYGVINLLFRWLTAWYSLSVGILTRAVMLVCFCCILSRLLSLPFSMF